MPLLTQVELTESPQSVSTMAHTLRGQTPWTFISAIARESAFWPLEPPFPGLSGRRAPRHKNPGEAKVSFPVPGREGLGLEAVRSAEAVFGALAGVGLEHGRAFLEHGLGEMIGSIFGQELHTGVDLYTGG